MLLVLKLKVASPPTAVLINVIDPCLVLEAVQVVVLPSVTVIFKGVLLLSQVKVKSFEDQPWGMASVIE